MRYKLVPIVLGLVCYLPAIVFVASYALGGFPPTIRQLFSILGTPVLLFIVSVGPAGLIADRESKSLSLYLASPLTRQTYLLGHAAALVAVLGIVTLGPPLLYLAGNVIVTGVGLGDTLHVIRLAAKISFCGLLLASYFAVLTMAVASITKRVATAALLLFVIVGLGSGLLAAAVLNGASPYLLLLDPGGVPGELVNRVFGGERTLPELKFHLMPMYLVAAATAGWAALAVGITWFRYRRLVVSR